MRKINVAYPSYNNVKDQPIGLSNAQKCKISRCCDKGEPQNIVFAISKR